MSVIKSLMLLSFMIGFTSCGVPKKKLTRDGAKIEILKSKRGTGCAVVDKVTGLNNNDSEDLAKNHARNLAARTGGNAIYFDEIVQNGKNIKVLSTVYQCQQ